MAGFKTSLINCQQCGRRVMVRPADWQRGVITCSHVGCGAVNRIQTGFYYDDNITNGLPEHGKLIYLNDPEKTYFLQPGKNIIGTSDLSTVQVDRFTHNGRCFISRQHCTITVTFDKWLGQLRYQIQDGFIDNTTREQKTSLNGTLVNGVPLEKVEMVDISNGGVITLGGIDRFQLMHFTIEPTMLNTYKVDFAFNSDHTQ